MASAQAISDMKVTLTAKVARWSAKHRSAQAISDMKVTLSAKVARWSARHRSAQAIIDMKVTLSAKVARWTAKHRRWVLAASVLVLVMDVYGQQFGLGLVVVVLIDATIIRSVLLRGDWNWYLPSWLEWLPKFSTTERAPEEAQPAEELGVSYTPQGAVAGPIPGRIYG